jgi:hypothetical protein
MQQVVNGPHLTHDLGGTSLIGGHLAQNPTSDAVRGVKGGHRVESLGQLVT